MRLVEPARRPEIVEDLALPGPVPTTSSPETSSAINKFLRQNGLDRERVSLYSACHSMKQKLMAVGAPEYVIDEILGHSDGLAKESYGDGLAQEVAAKWLRTGLEQSVA